MIAVTGASGRLGRLVVRSLLDRVDAGRVLALSRTPQAVAELGVATRAADFDDTEGLVAALDGVERLLLVSTNAFTTDGRRVRQHTAAVRAAVKAGVGHVLYTSIARAGDPAHPAAVAADHRATEAALADAGLPVTVLRNNMYSQLILLGLDVAVRTGVLADNFGAGAVSYVSRRDCAAVAATVLADGGYEGRHLEVTGPRAVTQAEVAALITELTGVPVRYTPISDEETVSGLVAHGMAEPLARRFATMGAAVREGYNSLVTDVVPDVTGEPAASVAEIVAAGSR